MIKLENYEVVGWEHAIRGMRNPMNSWEKSDSFECVYNTPIFEPFCDKCIHKVGEEPHDFCNRGEDQFVIGPNDFSLMTKLRNAGTDHRKFMRYLDVYVDITAPLYWWKEFKTYRHGRKFMDDEDSFDYADDEILEMHVETNSCSTMHKIHSKEFTLEDFSREHLLNDHGDETCPGNAGFYFEARPPINEDLVWNTFITPTILLEMTIKVLNANREAFLKTKDKKYWWQMIQLLPSSYNQMRTVKLNYEVLARMYKSRKNHKLDEWREFCKWIEQLPYSELITGE